MADQRTHIYPPDEVQQILQQRISAALEKGEDQTWTDVAAEIGISKEILGDIRAGRRVPTIGILLLVCKATGRTPNWFLGFEGED